VANSINFSGWNEFRGKVKTLPARVFEEIDGEVEDAMSTWEGLAKDAAPVDMGGLRSSIVPKQKALMNWELTVNNEIAAIMEWGSGHYVKVPSDLSSYASQFIGKPGGTAEEALASLEGWVKRKGIRFDSAATYKGGKKKGQNKPLTIEQTAYIIFHYIMLHGVRPHPFFFQHVPVVQQQVDQRIKNILTTEH
jgi:hypothetical protein